jgi:hypothetical protein
MKPTTGVDFMKLCFGPNAVTVINNFVPLKSQATNIYKLVIYPG